MEYCSKNKSYRGEKAADEIAEDFDVNKKLQMDLSALVKNAGKLDFVNFTCNCVITIKFLCNECFFLFFLYR